MAGTVDVVILGRTISLQADADGARVKRVVALMNEQIDDIKGSHPGLTDTNTAILAGLHLADRLLVEQDKKKDVFTRIGRECDDLLSYIDQRVGT
ncbi:MAG: cell division protein ZapA [Deltaproteobacteria bacterium]|nr:cell division protein ZapA [Deltaproteobacteria bacterium]